MNNQLQILCFDLAGHRQDKAHYFVVVKPTKLSDVKRKLVSGHFNLFWIFYREKKKEMNIHRVSNPAH